MRRPNPPRAVKLRGPEFPSQQLPMTKIIEFSEAQRSAIYAPLDLDQILILAGPGSGKTAVIVARIEQLHIRGITTDDIFVVTFTNKAARELTKRLHERGLPRLGYCGTIHSFCLRILEGASSLGWKMGMLVLDEAQSDAMLLQVAALIGCRKIPLSRLKEFRDKYGTSASDYVDVVKCPESLVVATYYKRLRKQNAIDFQGLLFEAIRFLKTIDMRCPFLFVDEYQDICTLDAEIFERLIVGQRFYVGDPDQSIYAFRGGDLHQILLQASDAETTQITLEENFRSSEVICGAAQKLIEHNQARVAKATKATHPGGTQIKSAWMLNEIDEAVQVCAAINMKIGAGALPTDFAVLARTNAIADEFRHYAKASYGWPIEDDREPFAQDTAFVSALLGYLAAPENDMAAELFIAAKDGPELAAHLKNQAAMQCRPLWAIYFNGSPPICHLASLVPHRMREFGCSQPSIDRIVDVVHTLPPLSTPADLVLALRSDEQARSRTHGVAITTMHSAKGREWPIVFLIGMEQEVVPGKSDIEEERRLIFVAATRAMDELILTHAKSRRQPFGKREPRPMSPSQFIAELMP